jgi:hypothetical protein
MQQFALTICRKHLFIHRLFIHRLCHFAFTRRSRDSRSELTESAKAGLARAQQKPGARAGLNFDDDVLWRPK